METYSTPYAFEGGITLLETEMNREFDKNESRPSSLESLPEMTRRQEILNLTEKNSANYQR
jgi:hypothetical protein